MKAGSKVETVSDFSYLRSEWDLPYPSKGDILTVSSITPHHKKDIRDKGIVLLTFEELPDLVPVCDKDFNGNPNFIELVMFDDVLKDIEKETQEYIPFIEIKSC